MSARAVATVPPEGILRIIRAEFDAMPGMRLSMPQVRRLWNLGEREGETVVALLVARGILARDERGRLCRAGELTP